MIYAIYGAIIIGDLLIAWSQWRMNRELDYWGQRLDELEAQS